MLHHVSQVAEQGREALARQPERGHRPHGHHVGLAGLQGALPGIRLQGALSEELARLHAHQVAVVVGLVHDHLAALEEEERVGRLSHRDDVLAVLEYDLLHGGGERAALLVGERPGWSNALELAALEAALSSTRSCGWDPSGWASAWECRAAHNRQVRPGEAQEPSWGPA